MTPDELKQLYNDLYRYLKIFGKEEIGKINGADNRHIYAFQDSKVRIVHGRHMPWEETSGFTEDEQNRERERQTEFEVIDLYNGMPIVWGGATLQPPPPTNANRWYSTYRQMNEIVLNVSNNFDFIKPYLQEMVSIFRVDEDDIVIVTGEQIGSLHKVIRTKTKRSKKGTILRYIPLTRDADEQQLGKKLYPHDARKVTKEELQKHFDRWKEIALKMNLT
jgi:hypothetical protein